MSNCISWNASQGRDSLASPMLTLVSATDHIQAGDQISTSRRPTGHSWANSHGRHDISEK